MTPTASLTLAMKNTTNGAPTMFAEGALARAVQAERMAEAERLRRRRLIARARRLRRRAERTAHRARLAAARVGG